MAAGSTALAAAPLRFGRGEVPVREFRLRPHAAAKSLVGGDHPPTNVWAYNDELPGPALRVRLGERIRVVVENGLDEETTVHWHGIRLANSMDGVPGLTQPPIAPGEAFTYEFTPPDAGTFWYHSHVRSYEQIGRGLYGPLIVEERAAVPVDRDVTWVLDDWRLTMQAAISEDFGNGHDVTHAGRLGNTVTVNGRIMEHFPVRAGERIRLRLINTANARNFGLLFAEHRPRIVAIDGQPVPPHEPEGGVVVLGAAMRIDLLLDCEHEPGAKLRVVDRFYGNRAYVLTELDYGEGVASTRKRESEFQGLPDNRLPEPDLERAERHSVVLAGGAMGGMRGAEFNGEWADIRTLARAGLVWAINGVVREPDRFDAPLFVARRGSSHVITLRNSTAFPHPMHLHGHHFRVTKRDGQPTRLQEWQDTVLVMPREEVEIAFKADNPGDWLFHCHVLEHMAGGMSGVIRVA